MIHMLCSLPILNSLLPPRWMIRLRNQDIRIVIISQITNQDFVLCMSFQFLDQLLIKGIEKIFREFCQSLIEIVNDVLDIFNADRKTNESLSRMYGSVGVFTVAYQGTETYGSDSSFASIFL